MRLFMVLIVIFGLARVSPLTDEPHFFKPDGQYIPGRFRSYNVILIFK